ncbi:NADH:ubiquinone oxidoreductase, subunit 1/F420H2 oxidoreductase subunit H [Syntrophomonas zehnderi OL-4]|uniref:NADH-quinone oxidoreductase subunit H n=1 Tax=Syntrophomonas zehnderi OL-4 TaxID=690567 RepID=A0A0E4C865_9FIRM|nr:NADH-quinone oxidoreductase subunit NuoH [Syntrophomonas zehnderi]CFX28863.1 NADH:ubiquinone oxidoreductase, subunit 1/F420H2 oxidoreductase subunit H [Syntrophomonas zehnderi OL-4]
MEHFFLNIAHSLIVWLMGLGLSSKGADLVLLIVQWICIVAIVTINVIVLIWLERKVAGFMQQRLGPNRLGPAGMFQTIADAIKLLTKEDIIPSAADRIIFRTAPIFFIIIAVMLYVVLPMGDGMQIVDLNVGVFYFISVASLSTICLLMAGWGSNNKWSLLGAMRSVAQMISYEIPLAFSLLGVIMIAGSLSLSDIVAAQNNIWFIILQPVAFITFFIAATAELNRGPFDMPEAEQELTAGAYTEYTGMRWALFFLAEYTNLVAVSALASTMFLGGWHGPWLPSWIWIIIKTYLVMLIFMWMKWTFPRIRMDHLMSFSWKVLIPVTLANILVTGAGIQFLAGMGW